MKRLLAALVVVTGVIMATSPASAEHTSEHVAQTQADCPQAWDPVTCPAPGEGGVPADIQPGESYTPEDSATATATAPATSYASATAARAQYQATGGTLPATGGPGAGILLVAAGLLLAGGVLARRIL
jgi:hypothetical protein